MNKDGFRKILEAAQGMKAGSKKHLNMKRLKGGSE